MADISDPISAAAASMAPQDAGYFAPDDTILARYANNQIAQQDVPQLVAASQQAAETPLRQQAWNAQDQEYHDRQDWRNARGQFLNRAATELQPLIQDPNDPSGKSMVANPEFNTQLTKLQSELPPTAANDPAFHAIAQAKIVEHQGALANQQRIMQTRAKSQEALGRYYTERILPYLSTEDGAAYLKELGEFQIKNPEATYLPADRMTFYGQKAKQNQDAMDEAKKTRLAQQQIDARIEAATLRHDLTSDDKIQKQKVDMVLQDPDAFPSHVDLMLKRKNPLTDQTYTKEELTKQFPAEMNAAQQWDQKLKGRELNAALAYDNPDDYVNGNLRGVSSDDAKAWASNLTPAQKQKRRLVWAAAHRLMVNRYAQEGGSPSDDGAANQSQQGTPAAAPATPAAAPVAGFAPSAFAPQEPTLTEVPAAAAADASNLQNAAPAPTAAPAPAPAAPAALTLAQRTQRAQEAMARAKRENPGASVDELVRISRSYLTPPAQK